MSAGDGEGAEGRNEGGGKASGVTKGVNRQTGSNALGAAQTDRSNERVGKLNGLNEERARASDTIGTGETQQMETYEGLVASRGAEERAKNENTERMRGGRATGQQK